MAPEPRALPLAGARVRLVPVPLVPIDRLYEIALCSGAGTTWRTRGLLVSPERFANLVDGELSFAIAAASTGQIVGHVGLHDFDPLSASGELSAFVDPRVPAAGLMAGEGIDLFLRYVFAHAGIRKVTIEMPTGHAGQIARALRTRPGVTHEGVRRDHVRMGDRLVDLDVYAAWADGFPRGGSPAETSANRNGSGPPSFTELAALLAEVAPETIDRVELTGGHRLADDLGLDSLALLDLVEALDARLAPFGPIDLDPFDGALTIQDLLLACEMAATRVERGS